MLLYGRGVEGEKMARGRPTRGLGVFAGKPTLASGWGDEGVAAAG